MGADSTVLKGEFSMMKFFGVLILLACLGNVSFAADKPSPSPFAPPPGSNALMVEVPNVVGLEIGKAREILEAKRLKVLVIDVQPGLAPNAVNRLKVTRQQPPAGWKLQAGTSIALSPSTQSRDMPQMKAPADAMPNPMSKPEPVGGEPRMLPPGPMDPRSR